MIGGNGMFLNKFYRSIKKTILLIICIQLVVLHPFFFQKAMAEVEFAKEKKDCEASKSKKWNSKLNRCLTSDEYQALRKKFQKCTEFKDVQEKKACMDALAKSEVGDLQSKKETLDALQTSSEVLGYAQMVLELIAKEGEKSDCLSAKINAAAGIAGLGVDIWLSFFAEDELFELQDRYKLKLAAERMDEKGNYEGQVEAFNYLEKEQTILGELDDKKLIAYAIMTGLYGIGMIKAIYEMTPWGAAGACKINASAANFMDDMKMAREGKGFTGMPSSKEIVKAGDNKLDTPEGGELPSMESDKMKFDDVDGGTNKINDSTSSIGDKSPSIPDSTPSIGDKSPSIPDSTPSIGDKSPSPIAPPDRVTVFDVPPVVTPPKIKNAPTPPTRPLNYDTPPTPPTPPVKPANYDTPPSLGSSVAGSPPKPPLAPEVPNNYKTPPKAPEVPQRPAILDNPPKAPEVASNSMGEMPKAPEKPKSIDPGPKPEPPISKSTVKSPELPDNLKGFDGTKPPPEYVETKVKTDKKFIEGNKQASPSKFEDVKLSELEGLEGRNAGAKNRLVSAKQKQIELDSKIDNLNKQKAKAKTSAQKRIIDEKIKDFEAQKTKISRTSQKDFNLVKSDFEAGDNTTITKKIKNPEFEKWQANKVEYDNYSKKTSATKAENDLSLSKKSEYETKLKEWENQKTKFENDSLEFNQKNEAYNQKMSEWKEGNKKVDLDSYNKEVTEFETQKNKYDQDMNKYKSDMENYNKEYSNFESTNKKYESDFNDFEKKSKDYDKKLADWESNKSLNSEYNDWKQKKTDYDNKMEDYNKKLDKHESEYSNWKNEKDSYDKSFKDYESKKMAQENEYKNQKEKYDNDVEANKKKLAEFEENDAKWQKENADYRSNVAKNRWKDAGNKVMDENSSKSLKNIDSDTPPTTKIETDLADSTPTKKTDLDASSEVREPASTLPTEKISEMDSDQMKNKWNEIESNKEISAKEKQTIKDELLTEFEAKNGHKPIDQRKTPKDLTDAELDLEMSNLSKELDIKKAADPETVGKHNSRQTSLKMEKTKRDISNFFSKGWEKFKEFGQPLINGFRLNPFMKHDLNDMGAGKEEKKEDGKSEYWNRDQIKKKDQVNNEKLKSRESEIIYDIVFNSETLGRESLEDVLLLDEEYNSLLKGGYQSPSFEKYQEMKKSGLFKDDESLALILKGLLDHLRFKPDQLSKIIFSEAYAADDSDLKDVDFSSSDQKKKGVWDKVEGQDDTEYEALKKGRDEDKGKQAGMMIGIGAGTALAGLGLKMALDKIASAGLQQFRMFFATSPGVAITSGMATLINGLLVGNVVEDKKMIEENIKKIKKIKKGFEETMAGMCIGKGDREDTSQPECYCFTDSGKRNEKRTKSKICQDVFAMFDANKFKDATNYDSGKGRKPTGCFSYNGQFDEKCSCRNYVKPGSKDNACYKLKATHQNIGSIGKALPLGTLGGAVNSITSDPGSISSLNGEAISYAAANVDKASKKWLERYNKIQEKNGKRGLEFTNDGAMKFASKLNKEAKLPMVLRNIATGSVSNKIRAARPADIEKKIEQTAKKENASELLAYSSMKKPVENEKKVEEKKKEEENWDFEEDKEAKGDQTFEDFMGAEYDYEKEAPKEEISVREETNIFLIISNRYLSTGLEKLFSGKDNRKPAAGN